MPAKAELDRKLLAAEMDLRARKEELEFVTKDNVSGSLVCRGVGEVPQGVVCVCACARACVCERELHCVLLLTQDPEI